MTGYRPRELSSLTAQALETLPVVVVTGLRQAGKTTFLLEDPVFSGRRYFTLDDFATLEAARREPEALIQGDGPVTIDEVQRCPELLLVIKQEVDRHRHPGRFVLSGSANLSLLSGVTDSLAGRALYLTLHPFTRRERLGRIGDRPFLLRLLDDPDQAFPRGFEDSVQETEILDGGLPPVALGGIRRDLWFLGYEQTYLERDLRDLSQVADLVTFRNLLRLVSLRTGQILNQSELARDARLPASTVARYLGLLEASFLIERLPPFLASRTTRLLKSPKIAFSDSGLAAHMGGVSDLSPTADEPLRGALFETFVGQNLSALLAAHAPRGTLSFWNVQGRHEVDFVVSVGRDVAAVEVKAATRFADRDLKGLQAFLAATPEAKVALLAYNGKEAVKLGERLFAVPLGLLLS